MAQWQRLPPCRRQHAGRFASSSCPIAVSGTNTGSSRKSASEMALNRRMVAYRTITRCCFPSPPDSIGGKVGQPQPLQRSALMSDGNFAVNSAPPTHTHHLHHGEFSQPTQTRNLSIRHEGRNRRKLQTRTSKTPKTVSTRSEQHQHDDGARMPTERITRVRGTGSKSFMSLRWWTVSQRGSCFHKMRFSGAEGR